MPVVDVDPDELRRLTGHDEKDDDDLLEDLFALGLEFEGRTEDEAFQLEFAPDRLDRLSVEGVARSLRYQYGDDRGVYVPTTNDPEWTIEVDERVPDERPYVTGAVVRGVDLDEDALDSLIQLQEKLHATMGRKRAKGAIGIHDLTMLKGGRPPGEDSEREAPTITYTGVAPDGDRFVPLDSDRELTPAEVLSEHPTGETYAPLVEGYERYPAIYDDLGLFSFPPVINGRRTEVSTESRELFVELTGTDQWTIDRMCNIVCYALDARGATVERVTVEYPDRTLDRPDLSVDEKRVSHDRVEGVLGVDLDRREVVDLLQRSGLDVRTEGGDAGAARPEAVGGDATEESPDELVYDVEVPPYRVDVLHPLDVVDDVGRAYGFNDLEPRYPEVGTVGGRTERSRREDAVREALVGLGFEDLLNFHLVSETENYERMGVTPGDDVLGGREAATIAEPYSEDYTMVRTWALPSLLMVLENNTHRAYPQDLAEIGLAAHVRGDRADPGDRADEVGDAGGDAEAADAVPADRERWERTGVAERRTVAAVLARHDVSYEDAKASLGALARAFGVDLATPPTDHPTFIDGRTARVDLDGEPAGVIGEVHPRVLVEHNLELPVVAFEFRLDALR